MDPAGPRNDKGERHPRSKCPGKPGERREEQGERGGHDHAVAPGLGEELGRGAPPPAVGETEPRIPHYRPDRLATGLLSRLRTHAGGLKGGERALNGSGGSRAKGAVAYQGRIPRVR